MGKNNLKRNIKAFYNPKKDENYESDWPKEYITFYENKKAIDVNKVFHKFKESLIINEIQKNVNKENKEAAREKKSIDPIPLKTFVLNPNNIKRNLNRNNLFLLVKQNNKDFKKKLGIAHLRNEHSFNKYNQFENFEQNKLKNLNKNLDIKLMKLANQKKDIQKI